MNLKRYMFLFVISVLSFAAEAQEVKIGYTNIELILAYMPESKSMEQQLNSYQKQLADGLSAKQAYAEQQLQLYLEKEEKNQLSEAEKEKWQTDLLKLDTDISNYSKEAEKQLQMKREALLTPILTKLQNALDKVAEDNGYTYILNQTTSAGVSTILYGPDEDDVTKAVMTELNIPMPE